MYIKAPIYNVSTVYHFKRVWEFLRCFLLLTLHGLVGTCWSTRSPLTSQLSNYMYIVQVCNTCRCLCSRPVRKETSRNMNQGAVDLLNFFFSYMYQPVVKQFTRKVQSSKILDISSKIMKLFKYWTDLTDYTLISLVCSNISATRPTFAKT